MTLDGGVFEQIQSPSLIRVSNLRFVKSFLAAIELNASVPGLHTNFFNMDYSMQFNGYFLNNDVRGMLE